MILKNDLRSCRCYTQFETRFKGSLSWLCYYIIINTFFKINILNILIYFYIFNICVYIFSTNKVNFLWYDTFDWDYTVCVCYMVPIIFVPVDFLRLNHHTWMYIYLSLCLSVKSRIPFQTRFKKLHHTYTKNLFLSPSFKRSKLPGRM